MVHAPLNARITELPEGHSTLRHGDSEYYYYFGTYYAKAEDGFAVIEPPPGVVVSYLPFGYTVEEGNGSSHFTFGGVSYRPFYDEGVLVFAVLGP